MTRPEKMQMFAVRDFPATQAKHAKRVAKLVELMKSYDVTYGDVLGSDALQTIDTQTENMLQFHSTAGLKITPKSIARLINAKTRSVIANSLEYFEIPPSYDTAFFMLHYMKTIEGMVEILDNIQARHE